MDRSVAVLIAVLCVACGSDVSRPGDSSFDARSLVDALRPSAAVVETNETVSQPFFRVAGRVIRVEGEDVQVFEYADATAAQAEAQQVSPDGGHVGTVIISWVAPPHFHRRGRVIALYVGSSERVMAALRGALGPQFAGR